MDNTTFVWFNAIACIVLISSFVPTLFFQRRPRRTLAAPSSAARLPLGTLGSSILMNLFRPVHLDDPLQPLVFTNAYRLVFNPVIIVVLVAIAILRKVR